MPRGRRDEVPDGQEVKLGDRVELRSGNQGTVVCAIDAGDYASAYPKEQRAYLDRGIVVLSKKLGLTHCTEPEPSMQPVKRDTIT
jgi:hypothetical protein